MLTTTPRRAILTVPAGRPPSTGLAPRLLPLLRLAAMPAIRLLAALRRRRADQTALHCEEVGDATLRDLGLPSAHSAATPCDLADIDAGLESTRMRLFTMTGQYWRGS